MKTFCWIVVAFSLLNYCYGLFVGRQLEESPDVQQLIQQKRDTDLQIDLLADKVAPLTVTISNLVQKITDIDRKEEGLAVEADQLSITHDKLQAEIDSKESLASMISMGSRSIYDGITLGAFAERGVMTESINFQRWCEEVSKSDAAGKRRALQIERDWINLDLDRSNEVAELKPIIEQQNELTKPYFSGLKDKQLELHYKLQPYLDALNSYDHQRTWSSIIFWPALFLALVTGRSSAEKSFAQNLLKYSESPAYPIVNALFAYGLIGSVGTWLWYLTISRQPDAPQKANTWVSILMVCGGVYYCSKGWKIIWSKSERKTHPFQAVGYILMLVVFVFFLLAVLVCVALRMTK